MQRIEAFGKKLFESCQTFQIKKLLEYLSVNANVWQCEVWQQEISQIKNFSGVFLLPAIGIEVALLTNQQRYGGEGVGS